MAWSLKENLTKVHVYGLFFWVWITGNVLVYMGVKWSYPVHVLLCQKNIFQVIHEQSSHNFSEYKKKGGGYLRNGDCMYFVKMAMVIVSVSEVTDMKEEGMESSLTLW